MTDSDHSGRLQERVRQAVESRAALRICAGNSKAFLNKISDDDVLDVSSHRGIISYEPTELVITARCGTPLSEIEEVLAERNQMLAFEPPHYGSTATLGGTVACNLSGPRRPYTGAARDYVLGTRIINGKAEVLRFGGEVMKNVAGYDVSRLMTGSMGTLGVMLDISLKVLPKPDRECTLVQSLSFAEAMEKLQNWSVKPLPISATCYDGEKLYVRISGAATAVDMAVKTMGGERLDNAGIWQKLREQAHSFFQSGSRNLWRLSVAADIQELPLDGKWLYEWGGALRWLISDVPADDIFASAASADGHATLYRTSEMNISSRYQPLMPGLLALHQRIKQAMDPAGVFNPGGFVLGA